MPLVMAISSPKPKCLLFANTDWYLYNFRLSLADKLRETGFEVVLVAPGGEYGPKMESLGYRWVPFEMRTRSINPLREIAVIMRLILLYRRERPKLTHHFTIKCVLYGTVAARVLGGISIVNSLTGLGYSLIASDRKAKLLRPVVRALCRSVLATSNGRVVLQNTDDRNLLVQAGIVQEHLTRVIRGSGVNTDRFRPSRTKGTSDTSGPVRVLFASRLLKDKGVLELLEAAKTLKEKSLSAEVLIAGSIYPDNPSSLSARDIEEMKNSGHVTYLGHVADMPSLLDSCDVVVLPSYYGEGTPRILIEAAAMEKPVIACDIAGCRGIVNHGTNGLLVRPRDATALAAAIEVLVARPKLREQLGKRGRRIVLDHFSERLVIDQTLKVYRELITLPCEEGIRGDPRRAICEGVSGSSGTSERQKA